MKKDQGILKYEELANWMEEEISSSRFRAGERFYSEIELSKKFQVNRQTVRKSFSVLEEKGLLNKKERQGMFVSVPTPPKLKTKIIGMISTYQESYIFPNIIKGIDQVLSESGYRLQLALTQNRLENEGRQLASMLHDGVDGIIVEPTKSALPNPNKELFKATQSAGIPIVFFNANYPEIKAPYVSLDDYQVGKMATKYLMKHGHQNIAAVMKSDDRQGVLRYAGYMDQLITPGLSLNSKHIAWYSTEDIPFIEEDFNRIYRTIKDCSAIFCYNDQIATKVIHVLDSMGLKVPEDFSVIGVDNSEYTDMSYVGLTSVAHPMENLGKAVAEKIISLLNNPKDTTNITFKPSVIERESVAYKQE